MNHEVLVASVFQPDGKSIVGGFAVVGPSSTDTTDFTLQRYNIDLSALDTFDLKPGEQQLLL